jgi:hypothetical protein
VNPLERNLAAAFLFSSREKKMTIVNQNPSAPALVAEKLLLSAHIKKDIEHAQRKLPVLGLLFHKRIQWFCIVDTDAECPPGLNLGEHRVVEKSAIHLPATTQALQKIKRLFREHSEKCNDGCKFTEPYFPILHDGSVIIYSVTTRINHNRH